MEKIQNEVELLANAAKKANLDSFEIEASYDKGFSVSARQGALETVEHHREKSIHITVYKDKKSGTASSSDLSEKSLLKTLEKACTLAKYTEPDPFAGLPDKEDLAFEYPDLSLNHPWEVSPADAIELALRCDEAARAYDSKVTQTEQAEVVTSAHHRLYVNSLGFRGEYASTLHGLSASVVAETNGNMERDFDYFYARNPDQLKTPEEIAKKAAKRSVERLGARKIKTQKCPVIFEARVAKSLWGHLIAAISGSTLYRKSSFLVDALGKQILPDFVTVEQSPHEKGGYGSAPFDDQGVKTRPLKFVESGVLQSYVLGCYSARKLGLKTTGNAGGVFNLRISPGEKTLPELCKEMGTGLLVTELMGQGVNLVTGDYSRGASGFWVENGEILYPVHETTVAGNLAKLFFNLEALGSDFGSSQGVQATSVLVDQLVLG